MNKWYKVPVDYNEDDIAQPKYADGYGLTYFGDIPFEGYSGIVIDGFYIVNIYATIEIHNLLQIKNDIICLCPAEVEKTLNEYHKSNYSFDELRILYSITND